MNTSSVSPTFCCPVVTRKDELDGNEIDDAVVDPKLAMMKEPIVGLESVTWEQSKGSGALPARPPQFS